MISTAGMKELWKTVSRLWVAVVIGLLLLMLLIAWGANSNPDGGSSQPTGTASISGQAPSARGSGTDLPTVTVDDLPREALDTLALINKGGPWPYPQDGSTFQNREGLLPKQKRGFYQEFTVKTPGAKNRGARRIIQARDGTFYYTDDHYESFKRIGR